eukprot:3940759-Rhodomonas_salina.4
MSEQRDLSSETLPQVSEQLDALSEALRSTEEQRDQQSEALRAVSEQRDKLSEALDAVTVGYPPTHLLRDVRLWSYQVHRDELHDLVVRYAISLRACCAMSGTWIAYSAVSLHACYAIAVLRNVVRYAVSGSEIGFGATRLSERVQELEEKEGERERPRIEGGGAGGGGERERERERERGWTSTVLPGEREREGAALGKGREGEREGGGERECEVQDVIRLVRRVEELEGERDEGRERERELEERVRELQVSPLSAYAVLRDARWSTALSDTPMLGDVRY